MPAADSCRTVRVDRSTLSPDSGTCGRPPAIRLTAFNAQPPNLPPAPLMDVDFAAMSQLVRRCRPHIRFLFIGSRLCSTLPSDPASRRRPCASLSLLLHQDVKGTYTPKLSIMRGVRIRKAGLAPAFLLSGGCATIMGCPTLAASLFLRLGWETTNFSAHSRPAESPACRFPDCPPAHDRIKE